MINLLPTDYMSEIRFGRSNAVILRWLTFMVLAIGGLVVIILAGWVYMSHESKNLSKNIAVTQADLTTQHLAQVQKDAATITGNIKVINQVLRQEIRFSDLMEEIGKVMPPGAVLSGLTLNKLDGALDLSVNARDYASATQVAVNLSDPKNNLFDKVDIINISCTSGPNVYKCTGSMKALFSKTTKNRFLSVAGSKP